MQQIKSNVWIRYISKKEEEVMFGYNIFHQLWFVLIESL